MGFETLNPMQLAVLSQEGRRIVLLAPTGSGKTVAFTIALLKSLEAPCGRLQGVVVAPSRELAVQTGEVIRRLAEGYKTSVFYGGHPMPEEISSIEGAMPDIVVATPGRLLDHLKRKSLTLKDMRGFVVDEYDKLLELGFQDEMSRIAKQFPQKLSLVMLTSATDVEPLPDYLRLDSSVVIDYTERTVNPRERMQVVEIESAEHDKLQSLRDLLLTLDPDKKTIVFVNHRESAERIFADLKKCRFPVGLYHGGQEQREREMAVDLFNNGSTPILVATDLAARGLDIQGVDAIVHYHLPLTPETYTHRNGRTARVDATGTIYVITSEKDNIPEFIEPDRKFQPNPSSEKPKLPSVGTIHINAGKREKISRGDILGYFSANSGIDPKQIGKIIVKDKYSLVAVPRKEMGNIIAALQPHKLKNKTVRLSIAGK